VSVLIWPNEIHYTGTRPAAFAGIFGRRENQTLHNPESPLCKENLTIRG
jgi:hypothetical protein